MPDHATLYTPKAVRVNGNEPTLRDISVTLNPDTPE